MRVYFEDNYGERKFLGESKIESVRDMLIHKDMEERNIHPHYLRYWVEENGEIYIDYGSYSSFYVLVPQSDDENIETLLKATNE
jgi:hypothetical protein